MLGTEAEKQADELCRLGDGSERREQPYQPEVSLARERVSSVIGGGEGHNDLTL